MVSLLPSHKTNFKDTVLKLGLLKCGPYDPILDIHLFYIFLDDDDNNNNNNNNNTLFVPNKLQLK